MDARTLRQAMQETHVSEQRLLEYLPHFIEAMRAAEITTVRRAAAWCSQIGHESAGLRYMAEIQTSHPSWSWDRTRYRGRGPIQITWSSNYRAFGQWCKARGLVNDAEIFVQQPELVEQPRWGFLAASWYWLNGGPRPGQINGFADAGDILNVSRCVNGWVPEEKINGLPDRRARWNRCLALGDALLPRQTAPAPPAPPQPEVQMREIPLEQANAILAEIDSRRLLGYAFGGHLNPATDCSGITMAAAGALEGHPFAKRHGSTESFRGTSGPVLGMIKAANRAAVPADSILKFGLNHRVNPSGPFGGSNAHMSGTFMGVGFESRGPYKGVAGHVVGGTARHWNDPMYNEYWYYPAKLGPAKDPTVYPLPINPAPQRSRHAPPFWYYGPLSGPLESISGEAGEPGPWIDGIRLLQARLGLPSTGKWVDAKPAIIAVQQEMGEGVTPNGTVGPRTWAHIMQRSGDQPPPLPAKRDLKLPANANLNTVVPSLVEGSNYEAPLGDFIRNSDKYGYLNNGLLEQILQHLEGIEARMASGGDQTGGQ